MSKTRHITKNIVMWDADWYKSLSDDDCIVCLTEKQVYLLSCIAPSLTWLKTRWGGDTSGLDVHGIQGDLLGALTDEMTCTKLDTILEQITSLQTQLTQVQTQLGMQGVEINFGDTINDILTTEQQNAPLGGTNGCDLDALWSGCVQIVDYIHNNNIQMLAEFEQNVGNSAATLANAVSGTPVVGFFPADEVLQYAANLVTNLKDEYEAITDEDFLNEVACELFCIAATTGDCSITVLLLLNWLNAHNVITIDVALTRIADIFSLLVNGTFLSSDSFWSLSAWQMVITIQGEKFYAVNGLASYEAQIATGYNSPDADWSILCEDCFAPVWVKYEDDIPEMNGSPQWVQTLNYDGAPSVHYTEETVTLTFTEPITLLGVRFRASVNPISNQMWQYVRVTVNSAFKDSLQYGGGASGVRWHQSEDIMFDEVQTSVTSLTLTKSPTSTFGQFITLDWIEVYQVG